MGVGRSAALAGIGLLLLATGTAWRGWRNLGQFDKQIEQINRETLIDANSPVPGGQRALLDYGAYLSFQFMAIDDATHDTHILRQTELTAYTRLNIDDVHEFFFRASTQYQDFNPHDSFNGLGDDWVGPSLDRAVYKFDLQQALRRYEGKNVNYDLIIQAGRQLVHWGNGLVLSEDLDGGVITGKAATLSLTLLGAVTADKALDFDTYRPGFADRTHRVFGGAMLEWELTAKHTLYAYGLVQQDEDPDGARTDLLAGTSITTRFRYNSNYEGLGARGELIDHLLYGVELVHEGGGDLSSAYTGNINTAVTAVPQQTDAIDAYAGDFTLEYLLTDERQTKFSAEALLASGSNSRVTFSNSSFGGNAPGRTDRGFNAFGLINTGLAFEPEVSNLFMVRTGMSTRPFPGVGLLERLQVGTDLFLFNKLSNDAPINEVTTQDGYLGFEADLYANWQILSDVSLSVRYGAFFPGRALSHVPDGNGSAVRNFFFTGVTFAF